MDVWTHTLQAVSGTRWRRVPITMGAQRRWHRDPLQGLVTTGGTPCDVDTAPLGLYTEYVFMLFRT